ncbi:putative cyclin 4 [Besnoitia besnoiti]|uniref:Putative cyclin 4 n=1 Tax=Besnoitia besnoiti TaxID=94643 RepID=A0A2A9MK26_BESBE|nr:putative cyclin 4 [Besnoitia besnoiti]PFH36611.1 putative cyclin 4 [Besnoitia besnoiti]
MANHIVLPPQKLLKCPPSVRDGLSPEVEREQRVYGCHLIQKAGILLKLEAVSIASAQTILHRFFFRRSLKQFDVRRVATAALLLACKLEEDPHRVLHLVGVIHLLSQLEDNPEKALSEDNLDEFLVASDSQEYELFRMDVFRCERYILRELGFMVSQTLVHPHRYILQYIHALFKGNFVPTSQLSQRAWGYLNDSMRTTLCCEVQPAVIAVGSIFLAACDLGIPLPQETGWHDLFDVSWEDVTKVCDAILSLYTRPLPSYVKLAEEPLKPSKPSPVAHARPSAKQTADASAASAGAPAGSTEKALEGGEPAHADGELKNHGEGHVKSEDGGPAGGTAEERVAKPKQSQADVTDKSERHEHASDREPEAKGRDPAEGSHGNSEERSASGASGSQGTSGFFAAVSRGPAASSADRYLFFGSLGNNNDDSTTRAKGGSRDEDAASSKKSDRKDHGEDILQGGWMRGASEKEGNVRAHVAAVCAYAGGSRRNRALTGRRQSEAPRGAAKEAHGIASGPTADAKTATGETDGGSENVEAGARMAVAVDMGRRTGLQGFRMRRRGIQTIVVTPRRRVAETAGRATLEETPLRTQAAKKDADRTRSLGRGRRGSSTGRTLQLHTGCRLAEASAEAGRTDPTERTEGAATTAIGKAVDAQGVDFKNGSVCDNAPLCVHFFAFGVSSGRRPST